MTPSGSERTTIDLRMRGFPLVLIASALVAVSPLAFVLYEMKRGLRVEAQLIALSAICAVLPWLSRLVGRLTYRASLDDVALHVGGEALPWNTITRVTHRFTWRREEMVLERGKTVTVTLVTRDLFAGRLEPIDELERRLPKLG
jgi:hypothetical protein